MELTSNAEGYGPGRERFIGRTFSHLGGAVLVFATIEIMLFKTGLAAQIAGLMSGIPWLAILAVFMLLGWAVSRAAHTVTSLAAQYAALGAYVLLESILFVPLLYIADTVAPGAISNAGMITIVATFGLVSIAYLSRKDFSFLRTTLMWGGLMAIALIVCGSLFGFELGVLFSVAMVGFAGAAILYDASNIIHHYPEDRYVGASLQLFASMALMFWYVLRIAISLAVED